ncbi:ParB N-terminal domain-containing protein [Limnoglobus roseus]|uniref:ParB-like nuclease n=1 Tax=Limnoglobus roseus TaxID=2598579 RepID=A0A5C1AMZ8_9BACT|nr:ParB N-terminal domain-containing protein [Limnoglobus roseus]QEL18288.1 ParB-like nuclease [Limnoglobus roseus]
MPDFQILRLDDIEVDNSIQPRAKGLDGGHVDDLAAAYTAGADIPPPVVWNLGGERFRLSQGYHRLKGAKKAKLTELKCEVRRGTETDCAIDSATSNQGHGLKRSNDDKRRCVELLLKLLPEHTDTVIAEKAGVAQSFVAERRGGVFKSDLNTPPSTRTGQDGRRYKTNKPKIRLETGEEFPHLNERG